MMRHWHGKYNGSWQVHARKQEELALALGFRRVVKALGASKLPLVGPSPAPTRDKRW